MKNSNKLIIVIAIAIAIAATVLVVSLVKPDILGEEKETMYSIYTLQPTTAPMQTQTESWVDLNAMASDLATTTEESTTIPESSTDISLPTLDSGSETVVVYVDQNGNIIDPDKVNKVTTSPFDNNIETFDPTESVVTTEPSFGSYVIDDKGVITKYLGDKKDVFIPNMEQGRKVTGIASGCFQGSNIRSVSIPETVTYIGEYAFADCKSLKSVSFRDASQTTVSIGQRAFQKCVSLKNVELPIVKNLGNAAFVGCTALESVRLSPGSEKIGDYCFEDCKALTKLSIPKTVKVIGKDILIGCDKSKVVFYCDYNSEAAKYAGKDIEIKPYE